MRSLILLACLLAGCSTYRPYAAIGIGGRLVNGESGLATCAEFGQQVNRRTSVAYTHCSDVRRGYPFNESQDTSHDTIAVWHRWGGDKR